MGKAGRKLHSQVVTTAALACRREAVCDPGDSQASEQAGVRFHALWTLGRSATIHIAPCVRTVQRGHQFLERIEKDIRHLVSDSTIFTHLESLDDPTGWDNVPSIEASVRLSSRTKKRPQRGEIDGSAQDARARSQKNPSAAQRRAPS